MNNIIKSYKKEAVFKIPRCNGPDEEMGEAEFTRWMCLMEGMHYINQEAEDREMKETDPVKLNPLALATYIDHRYNAMLHDVKIESALGRL